MNLQAPGFGGLFLEDDRPVLYLTDPEFRGAAESQARSFLAEHRIPGGAIEVRNAEYEWRDLVTWRYAIRPAVFGIEGAVRLHVDESRNRLFVGVTSTPAVDRVRERISELGIPQQAVIVEEVTRTRSLRIPEAFEKGIETTTLSDSSASECIIWP